MPTGWSSEYLLVISKVVPNIWARMNSAMMERTEELDGVRKTGQRQGSEKAGESGRPKGTKVPVWKVSRQGGDVSVGVRAPKRSPSIACAETSCLSDCCVEEGESDAVWCGRKAPLGGG